MVKPRPLTLYAKISKIVQAHQLDICAFTNPNAKLTPKTMVRIEIITPFGKEEFSAPP
jgi:hypothetical protein